MEFVRCIKSLLFDNELFNNMNGFLTEPVKQKRGLLQEDSISPILFNFAIETFIQSIIISNSDISGYTLQSTKPAQQWSIQLAVKVLAYADDILILVKYQPKYIDMEECIETYAMDLNSNINYDKSIAFPTYCTAERWNVISV